MRHPHWSSDHRDALLSRVTAITVGVAAASAAGAVALGAGLQAGTTYAAAKARPKPAEPAADAAPVEQPAPATEPSTQPSAAASSPVTAAQLRPDQVHLVIYNATTTRGVAAAAASILRQEGFHVDSVASNPGGVLRTSSIVFSADAAGGVRAVTKATGIQQTATGDTGRVVLLVLGRDWVSATAGTAWAPPQAVPQQPQQQTGGSSGGGSSSGGGGTTTSGGS
ncbi:MAG TPA: LytR C-terminal domain-containing protein [Candidatus Nanopelagicales bacterium]|nr:LytR C-terminal domain-containing protein [Candidatus Nanopelagicales bacterium]